MKAKYLEDWGNGFYLWSYYGKFYLVKTREGTQRAKYLVDSYLPIDRIGEISEEELHERFPHGVSFLHNGKRLGINRSEKIGYVYEPWTWDITLKEETYKGKILEMMSKNFPHFKDAYFDPHEYVVEYDERPKKWF